MKTVAYQGAAGAFGHEACLTFLPGYEPVAKPTFAAVVESVIAGEADLGMLPVENAIAGPVAEVGSLLAKSGLVVVARHSLPVHMHLMAMPGTALESIRTVVSHPIALAQCRETLDALGVVAEPAANTALAAQALADPAKAVLASEAAATAYGLVILKRDVHDRPDNSTRFVTVAREPHCDARHAPDAA